jgi:hypothetical protein
MGLQLGLDTGCYGKQFSLLMRMAENLEPHREL